MGRIAILALLAIAACGDSEPEAVSAPDEPGPSVAASMSAGTAAGCWPMEQRENAPSGGTNMVGKQYSQAPAMAIDPAKRYTATLETNKGTIEAELYP